MVTTGPPQLSAVPDQCCYHCEHIHLDSGAPSVKHITDLTN